MNLLQYKYLVFLLSVLLFSSCDLFNTRPAEEPGQSASNFVPPIEAEDVIANLINSLKDKNVLNYLACFSDSSSTGKALVFSPSGGAFSQFPELADSWDKKNEEQYFNNMKVQVPENKQITLTFSNFNYSRGDSVIYSASYTLTVPHDDSNIPLKYEGDLRFSMVRSNGSLWSIYYWIDTKSGELPTWSELKGRFY